MKLLLVFATIVANALARPQNGYAYNRPANGGLLLNTVRNGNNGFFIGGSGAGISYANGAANLLVQPTPTPNLIVTPTPTPNILVTSTPAYATSSIAIGGAGGYLLNGGGGASYLTSAQVQQPIQPIIQKHIYVHVPPPEIEEPQPQRIITPVSPPVTHYKIIFIKVPSQQPSRAQILAQRQAAAQEKTLIYVLTKKPDEVEDLVLPPPPPVQPSKPEVFFIKYKSQSKGLPSVADNIINTIGATGDGVINAAAYGGYGADLSSLNGLNGGIVSTTVSPIGLEGVISTVSPINTYSSTITPIDTYSSTISPLTLTNGISSGPILTTQYGPPDFIKKKKK